MKDDINFGEYGTQVPGCVRACKPGCPFVAVIPSVVISDKSGIKNLADCFVHVTNINTTFYIDEKHRIIVTWAGPVEVEDYDYKNNPSGLRSQFAIDYKADRAIYYNAIGEYRVFPLSKTGDTDTGGQPGGGGTDTETAEALQFLLMQTGDMNRRLEALEEKAGMA